MTDMLWLFCSSAAQYDLGAVCQNMWDKAGNNLKVPLELKVDTAGKNPLFKLETAGQNKIDLSDVFKKFEGR